MIKSQWSTFLFWVGAVFVIVLVTVFYQPAAAKTGSLLVWTKNRIYVMDIDSLVLERVGLANANEVIAPAPGCFGQTATACWVTAGQNVYNVDRAGQGQSAPASSLPVGEGFRWLDSAVSWSPDGLHLAYSVFHEAGNRAELRIYNAQTMAVQTVAQGVDATIEPAWTASCAGGLQADSCKLAFKTDPVNIGIEEVLPRLVAQTLATGEQQTWELPSQSIFELRWGPADKLLYSQPKRHFHYAEDYTPAYNMAPASKLGNMSPDGIYTVYYQAFKLQSCLAAETDEEACLHLGVWLAGRSEETQEPKLIYDVDLSQPRTAGLNFIPVWSPDGKAFVFFQEGNLIHYDVSQGEATIWYKSVRGKLRSIPIFSPNGEAVAFVDNQGEGFSEYRLVVVNPRLQPIEHIIDTKSGFRVLAWLPN